MMLKPFEFIYQAASSSKNILYDKNILKSHLLKSSVISVGNLSFGGTGKTPCIVFLAQEFSEIFKVSVVCRSYKAQLTNPAEVDLNHAAAADYFGDEACLLKRLLPKCRVWAGPQKFATAVLADEQKPDLILVDDGFSHRQLTRQFDLVLFDASRNSDYYRESFQSLKRSQAVLLTKVNFASPERIETLTEEILRYAPQLKGSIYEAQSETSLQLSTNEPLFVFCGLARPESFHRSLKNLGFEVIQFESFADHFKYDVRSQQKLIKSFRRLKKTSSGLRLVTTEKDFVKITDSELLQWVNVAQNKMILNETDKVGLLEKIRSNL